MPCKRGAGAQSLPMIWPRGAKARIGVDCEAADRPSAPSPFFPPPTDSERVFRTARAA